MSMIKSLLEYQEVDKKIYDLQIEALSSKENKALKLVKNKINQLGEELVKTDKQSKETIKKYEELDSELKKLQNELSEYDDIIDDMESSEESDYCLKKINELIGKIETVSKQIDNTNKQMDKTLHLAEKIMKEYNEAVGEKSVKAKEFDAYRNTFKDEVISLNKKLDELKKDIPAEIVEKYQNLRNQNKKFPLVVELKDKTCQGCFIEIPGVYEKLNNDVEVAECTMCGRLVYKK